MKTSTNALIASLMTISLACGGKAGTTDSNAKLEGLGVGPNGTPLVCSGKNIQDDKGTTVGTCAGVYNTCADCALAGGAVCIASTPVCEGELTGPDGQLIAFSSNGCNIIGCDAVLSQGLLTVDIHTPEFRWHIGQVDQSTVNIEVTDSSGDYEALSVPATVPAMTSVGSAYSLAAHGALKAPSGGPAGNFTLNIHGLVTVTY